jgi:hypothetical protein
MEKKNGSTENPKISIEYFGRNKSKVRVNLIDSDPKESIVFDRFHGFYSDEINPDLKEKYAYENFFTKYRQNNLFKYLNSASHILDDEYREPHGEITQVEVGRQIGKLPLNTIPVGSKPKFNHDRYEKRLVSFLWYQDEIMKLRYGLDIMTYRHSIVFKGVYKDFFLRQLFVRILDSFICCEIDIRLIENQNLELLSGLNQFIEQEIPLEYNVFCKVADEFEFDDYMELIEYIDPKKVLAICNT